VLASAGVLSEEESVGAPQYSQEELNAIVEEAAMWGRRWRRTPWRGGDQARGARRRRLSRAWQSDRRRSIRLMKEHGTYLVADIYNDDTFIAEYTRLGFPPEDHRQRTAGGPPAA